MINSEMIGLLGVEHRNLMASLSKFKRYTEQLGDTVEVNKLELTEFINCFESYDEITQMITSTALISNRAIKMQSAEIDRQNHALKTLEKYLRTKGLSNDFAQYDADNVVN
ncbi:hypothetical protein M7775_07935 [Sporomusa sphaeroides DSM 2875]|uniref:hypothetical protein n=1 Tax=Sporomusa sphaeroides TaxID=47679 RepID=UPI00203036A3|nr:hypothetical protein [Sporomusa sphaeroides]MCM0758499.1 hypothetical protein [Sporomusa sphaeroides DSM 2875]